MFAGWSAVVLRGTTLREKRKAVPCLRQAGLGILCPQDLLDSGKRAQGLGMTVLGFREGALSKAVNGEAVNRGDESTLDDIVADGVEDKLGDGVEIELEHDIGAVRFRCFYADVQKRRDFFVALAFR